MTKDEFDAALSETRIKPTSNAAIAARLVLVDGISRSDVGRMIELSRQRVSVAVSRIEEAYYQSLGVPDGWGVLPLILPIDSVEWRAAESLQKKVYLKLKAKK